LSQTAKKALHLDHHCSVIAGGDMDDAALRLAATEYEARLQLKVRRPLAQWVGALDTVRVSD
jgi:ribulose-5-phosphate 4-epimerase/fuculose-1-phosphate aldolase